MIDRDANRNLVEYHLAAPAGRERHGGTITQALNVEEAYMRLRWYRLYYILA